MRNLSIKLPHAGPEAYLSLKELAKYFLDNDIDVMPINNRAQVFADFKDEHLTNTLDPVIRNVFLPKDSPYKNTMQAVSAVTDALVESGLFSRETVKFEGFGKRVNSLRINHELAQSLVNS